MPDNDELKSRIKELEEKIDKLEKRDEKMIDEMEKLKKQLEEHTIKDKKHHEELKDLQRRNLEKQKENVGWNKLNAFATPGTIALVAPILIYFLKRRGDKKKCNDCEKDNRPAKKSANDLHNKMDEILKAIRESKKSEK